MRRIIGWSIPLVLIMIGLLWPLVFKGGHEELPADDPVVFSNFKADFSVSADGSMDAVETITADFPGRRHGLFQYWDTANQNHPFVRQVPDIQSVEIDGVAAPYQMLWEDGKRFRIAKIGNPDEYLSYGPHVFEIRYRVPGVLGPAVPAATRRSPTPPSALAPVLALGQSYAQLNSSNNFLNLQDNLADTENKLAFARQYYNDAVATLNRLISALPWTFVAPLSGVSEREFYRTPR